MTTSWRQIAKQAGDAHLGQTLVRLAALAAAAHRFEVAQPARDAAWQGRNAAGVSAAADHPVRTDADPAAGASSPAVDTEVPR